MREIWGLTNRDVLRADKFLFYGIKGSRVSNNATQETSNSRNTVTMRLKIAILNFAS